MKNYDNMTIFFLIVTLIASTLFPQTILAATNSTSSNSTAGVGSKGTGSTGSGTTAGVGSKGNGSTAGVGSKGSRSTSSGSSLSLVETACRHSRHNNSCIRTLQSDPSWKGSDLKGLAKIAIKLASANASETADHLKDLLDDESLDPAVQDGISECLEFYLDAAEQLDDSAAALLSDSFKDVKTWVKVAVTDSISCDAAFEEGATNVMSKKNENFRRLCSYVLSINKVLDEKIKS